MAGCKIRNIKTGEEITEEQFKAKLLNGAMDDWYRVEPSLTVSESNIKIADKVIANIIDGKTTLSKALDFISGRNLSEATRATITNYIRQQLAEKRRGTKDGLEGAERDVYNSLESKFLNKEVSYTQVMYDLGTQVAAAEQAGDNAAKEKFENMRDIFYKENFKRAQNDAKVAKTKDVKDFNEEINDTRLGLSEDELRLYNQEERITGSGKGHFKRAQSDTVDFVSDTQLQDPNDQIVQVFKLNEFGADLNKLLLKFQMHYGADKYLSEMEKFVADDNNQLDARISVSTILNNHLRNLIETSTNPTRRTKLQVLELRNAAASQPIARRVSLALNALRAWNGLTNAQQSWVGIINPVMASDAQVIQEALGDDISDTDMFKEEDGVIEDVPDDKADTPDDSKPKKTAGFFARKKVKSEGKNISLPDPNDIKERIKKQKDDCK